MRKMRGFVFPCGGGGGWLAAVAMRVVRYRWTLACTGGLTADIRCSRAHAFRVWLQKEPVHPFVRRPGRASASRGGGGWHRGLVVYL